MDKPILAIWRVLFGAVDSGREVGMFMCVIRYCMKGKKLCW